MSFYTPSFLFNTLPRCEMEPFCKPGTMIWRKEIGDTCIYMYTHTHTHRHTLTHSMSEFIYN
jgi:hypothetical protein